MLVNNEVGTAGPVEELTRVAYTYGMPTHVDTV